MLSYEVLYRLVGTSTIDKVWIRLLRCNVFHSDCERERMLNGCLGRHGTSGVTCSGIV